MSGWIRFISSILILLSGFSLAHAGERITLCSADSPPWTIKKGQSPSDIEGLAVDLMNEMFTRLDMDIHMVALPFKRCLEYTKDGTLDGCFMTIKNKERETYAEFSDPYLPIPTFIYYPPDKFKEFAWKEWQDLKPYKIGSQRGFKYGQAFTTASTEVPLQLVEIPSVRTGIDMLFMGRMDMILINEFRLNYLVKRYPEYQGKLVRAEKPVSTGVVYIAISRKSPHVALVPKLNEVIAEMTDDGTIQKIVHQ